jgi:hypothetical protein
MEMRKNALLNIHAQLPVATIVGCISSDNNKRKKEISAGSQDTGPNHGATTEVTQP